MKVATLKYNGTGEVDAYVTAYEMSHMNDDHSIVTLIALAIRYETIVPFKIGVTAHYVNATNYPSPQWSDSFEPLSADDLWKYDQLYSGIFKDVRIGKIDTVNNYSGLNDTKILDWLSKEKKIFLTNEVIVNALFEFWLKQQEDLEQHHKEESEKIQKLVSDLNKKMTQHRINRMNIQKIQEA